MSFLSWYLQLHSMSTVRCDFSTQSLLDLAGWQHDSKQQQELNRAFNLQRISKLSCAHTFVKPSLAWPVPKILRDYSGELNSRKM